MVAHMIMQLSNCLYKLYPLKYPHHISIISPSYLHHIPIPIVVGCNFLYLLCFMVKLPPLYIVYIYISRVYLHDIPIIFQ